MLTTQNKNRRRHTRKKDKVKQPRHPQDPLASLREQEQRINLEIGSLEGILEDLNAERTTRHQSNGSGSKSAHLPYRIERRSRLAKQASKHDPKRQQTKKDNGVLQFLLLLAIAIALAGWLIYTGG